VADETFLLPVRGALANTVEMFALSEVAQFVWSLADGTRGVEDMVAMEFDVTEEQARIDVVEFVINSGLRWSRSRNPDGDISCRQHGLGFRVHQEVR
jgi:hypothetical protein